MNRSILQLAPAILVLLAGAVSAADVGSASRLSLRESSATFAERKATAAACEPLHGAQPAAENWQRAGWRQAADRKGLTTADERGDVLILGGTTEGPSRRGGQAQWSLAVEAGKVRTLWLAIETNGAAFWYKGVHSLQRGGTVDVFVNGVRVKRITCTERQEHGDYWPPEAPPGSSTYIAGPIDVSAKEISGPTLNVVIVANPNSAVDVHAVALSAER